MREILFRGKSIKDNEWYEGSLCETKINYPSGETKVNYIISVAEINVGKDELDFVSACGYDEFVYPETVGQYTGLTDKTGTKMIFEGDIGRYKQTDGAKRNGKPIICTGKVVYNAKTASFAVESKDEAGCKYFDYFPIKDFEVIGNIYDNPELLGG